MEKYITGIHHVAIKACGEEQFLKTVAFYRDVLGLETVRTWGEGNTSGAMLAFGEGYMELSAAGDPTQAGGPLRHVAFRTTDVDALVEKARAAGFAVTMEPRDICIPSNPPLPARIAFVVGVCGEEIELFCEK
ncbi:MAG: VOC family protein [Clostridia bacterium]|nr:VOC family protein [Clostridia bacterium]